MKIQQAKLTFHALFLYIFSIKQAAAAANMITFSTCVNKKLTSNPFETVAVDNVLECARLCTRHVGCGVANYKSQSPEEVCELFGYEDREEECMSYQEDTESTTLLPAKKCLHGGHLDANGTCSCVGAYSGQYCQDEDCNSMNDYDFTTDSSSGVRYRFGTTAVNNRDMAKTQCEAAPGAHLLSNMTILAKLGDDIQNCPAMAAATRFHVDGRGDAALGKFVSWENKILIYPGDAWIPGQPNNTVRYRTCIFLTKNGHYGLNDLPCMFEGYPICQLDY